MLLSVAPLPVVPSKGDDTPGYWLPSHVRQTRVITAVMFSMVCTSNPVREARSASDSTTPSSASSLLACPKGVVENDANAAAWAEVQFGAGRGQDRVASREAMWPWPKDCSLRFEMSDGGCRTGGGDGDQNRPGGHGNDAEDESSNGHTPVRGLTPVGFGHSDATEGGGEDAQDES